jgi:Protein of unknown function (DUF2673)
MIVSPRLRPILAAIGAAVPIFASTMAATQPASASTIVDREVWIGSPVNGTWTSDAYTHHYLDLDPDVGDWAGDIGTAAGQQVIVYVAPQTSGYIVTTRVDHIGPGCGGGANGARFVNVGIYVNNVRIGSVSYAHLNPSVREGQWISRWGSVVGTVAGGLPVNQACWTGPHVHMQSYNVHNWSCFNRGYRIGSSLARTNFVSFVGGHRVSGSRQACP